ncbi:MAG: type II toxin-antitoxin system HicB family antitoxin [Patescibacteria group bacterium]
MFKAAKKMQVQIKTDYGAFSVVLEREPDIGGYMVTAPKVADVVTWGKTIAHAKRMAKEAIECSIEGDVLIAAEKEGLVSLRKQHAHA